jgi:propionyl-CoA synthetase
MAIVEQPTDLVSLTPTAAVKIRELIDRIRQQIGPVAGFKTAMVVKRLPKTRSGKILRGTMKRIADSQAYTAPATIDDPIILDEITDALKAAGYAKGNA